MTAITKTSVARRALVLQHEEATPPGRALDWLEAYHIEWDVVRVDLANGQVDAEDYDIVIPLGSEFAPYQDEIPWIPREAELLRRVHDSGRSVFGICFGGQLLARALGGRGHRARHSEIGWLPIGTRDAELLSNGPWFQWHFDTFEAPPGAQVVAANEVGPQAYVAGQSMGLQFHPEVTPSIMQDWVKTYRHELDQEGVDPDRLLADTERVAQESGARARRLFDAFMTHVVQW